ncbi:MAG TPA: hypothetical protein VG943_07885 [Caulobacterales bacterium]|nr:hypothetical protein [Caulobacterales bacterium]
MLYLIDQHIWLLLLVVAFAAMGGWAWSALNARPREEALQRERERLMREVLNNSVEGGAGGGVSIEHEREMDTLRRRADLDAARIAEMERALEAARSRADEAAGRAAAAERALESAGVDGEELQRLRAAAAVAADQESRTVDVEPVVAPVAVAAPDEEREAQAWRLRYFEQRVRYLESQARPAAPLAAPVVPPPSPPVQEANGKREAMRLDWRARYAEARARHLEQALRTAMATTPAPEPEGAPQMEAPRDMLSEWRMSYLEKRLAHAQGEAAKPAAPAADQAHGALEAEAERLKWRNRYLESRLRHVDALLAARAAEVVAAPAVVEPAQAPQPVAAPVETPPQSQAQPAPAQTVSEEAEPEPAPLVPAGAEERPPSLPAARSGAPDDLTLIDGVSPMLQSTLHSLGVYHFEQIANWSPANIAWLDQYLRLRGRIVQEEWVEQAADLAREGPAAARRMLEDEYA